MKLFNIFKKENTTRVKVNIQKMDKKQLEKVIGGGDGSTEMAAPGGPLKGIDVKLGTR